LAEKFDRWCTLEKKKIPPVPRGKKARAIREKRKKQKRNREKKECFKKAKT